MSRCSFGGKLFAVTTVVFLTLVLVGCDGNGGKNNPVGGGEGKLVLGDKEAWVACSEYDDCEGWIFKKNGDVFVIAYNDDKDAWFGIPLGMTYTADDKTITISIGGLTGETINYCFSGNSLILETPNGKTTAYTKKSGLNITIIEGGTVDGGGDDRLVLGNNEAWTGCFSDEEWDYDYCEGLIFKENGDYIALDYDEDSDLWYGSSSNFMKYSAKNNVITLFVTFLVQVPVDSFSYNISGNTLTITNSDGETMSYTKTGGLKIVLVDDELFKSSKPDTPSILSKSSFKTKKVPVIGRKMLSNIAQK
jgi:ssDNA-binding Zn-finger/Zn-ribbon topoisomerase 1